ncbi:MAG: penicillin-binding transpeptidase domain-containing protein [Planctomycetales bacterium]
MLQNLTRLLLRSRPIPKPIRHADRTGTTRRDYPQGALASHIIGYRTRLTEERIQERTRQLSRPDPLNYQAGDWMGQTGIEKFYESELRGLRGKKKVTTNLRGEILREEIVRESRPGRDLELTLDSKLQHHAEELLERALQGLPLTDEEKSETPPLLPVGGALAIMDIRTGELLAAASAPHFDLRVLTDPAQGSWKEITSDPRHPLFPRLTRMQIPAGSVFKTVTAVGLLHQEGFNPDRADYCQGFLKTPDRFRCLVFTHSGVGHFDVDLAKAMAQSCNVYFFKHAPKLGASRLADWGRNFGFGERTGVDLPGEERGFLPAHQPGKTRQRGRDDIMGLCIGQGTLLVTPLQVVRMMAAVANGGTLVTPHLLRANGYDSLSENSAPKSGKLRIRHLDPQLLARVREGLEQVVSHPQGTGYKTVRLAEVKIAGKTGTAEVAGKPDHAWFAGYVPADRPRYAIVSVLEHGGSGGKAAGPLAREMIRAMLEEGLLRPQGGTPQTPVTADLQP